MVKKQRKGTHWGWLWLLELVFAIHWCCRWLCRFWAMLKAVYPLACLWQSSGLVSHVRRSVLCRIGSWPRSNKRWTCGWFWVWTCGNLPGIALPLNKQWELALASWASGSTTRRKRRPQFGSTVWWLVAGRLWLDSSRVPKKIRLVRLQMHLWHAAVQGLQGWGRE